MRTSWAGLLFLCASAAYAQSGELWFNAGASVLSNTGLGTASTNGSPNDYKLDSGFKFGFRFGFNTTDHIGHEIQYAYSRTHLKTGSTDLGGMAIHQGGYNFLGYATKTDSRIRPFGTAGLGFFNYVPPGASAT